MAAGKVAWLGAALLVAYEVARLCVWLSSSSKKPRRRKHW